MDSRPGEGAPQGRLRLGPQLCDPPGGSGMAFLKNIGHHLLLKYITVKYIEVKFLTLFFKHSTTYMIYYMKIYFILVW